MSSRFIIGRAGSGKTHFLHEQIVRHIQHDPINSSVILLVPKQATFLHERKIATTPSLGGMIHVRVLSLDDLAELALVETGSPHSARLDATGRSLILGHLLRIHAAQLPYFKNSVHTAGLAGEIDASFSEFERAGRDLSTIDQIIADAEASPDSQQQAIARKLTDLRLLYKLYQDYVAAHGFDPFDRQQKAHLAIENCPLIQRSLVLIDDYYDFTSYERKLICSLALSAHSLLIGLMLDPQSAILKNPHLIPDEIGVFYKTESAYRKLFFDFQKEMIPLDSPVLLSKRIRYQSKNLQAIEANFEGGGQQIKADSSIELQLAGDMPDEVSSAAARIRQLLAEGFRLREIAVMARSIDEYEPFINTIFAEHQIPYFVDKRRTAIHHPLIRAIQGLGRIVTSQWGNDAVMELLRSGLVRISQTDADLLEDYIQQHNITRQAWTIDQPWSFHKTLDDENQPRPSHFSDRDVEMINSIRVRLRKIFVTLTHPDWIRAQIAVRERVNVFFAALNELGIPAELIKLIQTAELQENLQQRAEFELAWTRLIELTDQLVELLGDTTITGQQFFSMMQTSLEEMELAITPPTVDQVLVGSIERSRMDPPRAVIFLGMNNDQFPLAISEQAVLNDRDRSILIKQGIDVEPPSRQKILQEQFLGYLALTRASEKLILIRTQSDDEGNEKEPSPFWTEVQQQIPDLQVQLPTAELEKITTPGRLVMHLLDHIRIGPLQSPAQIDLYNWLAGAPANPITKLRDKAWPSLSYTNQAVLTGSTKQKLFQSPLYTSVSRIESYASCPFQHFVKHGLKLQEPSTGDISAIDLGNLYHNVLEKIVRTTIDKKIDFTDPNHITPEMIRSIATEVGAILRNQIFLSSAQNRFTLEHLEEVVERLIRTQQQLLEQGSLRPAYVELEFGRDGDLPPLVLKLDGDKEIILSGKIDRVDIDFKSCKYTVIDYKLSGQSLDLSDVAHGLMLQLLTYLLVVNASGTKLSDKPLTPAAAFYLKVLRKLEPTHDPASKASPGDAEYMKQARPDGVINRSSTAELDRMMEQTNKSEYYAMQLNKDGAIPKRGQLVSETQFENLIKFVEEKIKSLCREMMAGDISITPYLMNGKYSPCISCSFRSVCRFDKLINRYRGIKSLTREAAMELIEASVKGEKR